MTSGQPILEAGASRATRWWQARAISSVTAAEGRAVHGGDDRLAEGLDAAQVPLDGHAAVEEVLGGLGGDADQVAQVAAGEGLLGGGDDDAPDVVLLGLQAVGDHREGLAERLVHGVRGLGGVVEGRG